MLKKISIIGHFGGDNTFLDGQTRKTQTLYDELSKIYDDITIVDTYYKKEKPIRLLFHTLKTILVNKTIFILVSENGMSFFFPLLYFFARFFKKRVFHSVIGGRLDFFVEKNPSFVKYLNSFTLNLVETNSLKEILIEKGIKNIEVIPNFRRLKAVKIDAIENSFHEPFVFCTFSRVMKEKGIENAIEAIENINKKYGKLLCYLDIYGPIDSDYSERFSEILSNASEAISYCGQVKSNNVISTLKNYYALLFPSYWEGEGSPGTIIESFFAGLPIIATDWNCNSEMVSNGYNGIIYPSEISNSLIESIEWILNQKNNMKQLKENCVRTSGYYLPDKHILKLISMINEESNADLEKVSE